MRRRPEISIIIPTLNEEAVLPSTLASIPPDPRFQRIVVDGGSDDATTELAGRNGCLVRSLGGGRAFQMNAGAAEAGGEYLLFLHADTRLPGHFDQHVRAVLEQPRVAAGAFRLSIDASSLLLRAIAAGANWRARYWQLPYGDQALFLKKATFLAAGGFPPLPIMEDFVLVRRLRAMGSIRIAPASVVTSARRWQRLGPLKATWMNQVAIAGYALGADPSRLARWYRGSEQKK